MYDVFILGLMILGISGAMVFSYKTFHSRIYPVGIVGKVPVAQGNIDPTHTQYNEIEAYAKGRWMGLPIQIWVALFALVGVICGAIITKGGWPFRGGLATAETTVSETATGLCDNSNPVRIISIPGREYEPAVRIHKKLKERGCKVEGPYPRTDSSENPAHNEVRYFHESDKDDANHVADFVKSETNGRCDVKYLNGFQDEPKGQLEVWIKKQSGK